MGIKLYLPRMGHTDHERMMQVHHWIEAQFGRPDYHKNYSLDFGDHTDDWCCYHFYDATQAFWAQHRWGDLFLTEQRWLDIVESSDYQYRRDSGTLNIYADN